MVVLDEFIRVYDDNFSGNFDFVLKWSAGQLSME